MILVLSQFYLVGQINHAEVGLHLKAERGKGWNTSFGPGELVEYDGIFRVQLLLLSRVKQHHRCMSDTVEGKGYIEKFDKVFRYLYYLLRFIEKNIFYHFFHDYKIVQCKKQLNYLQIYVIIHFK